MTRDSTAIVLISVTAVTLAAAAWAGDLNPPSGPVVATGKPLVEVEPRIAINAVNTPGDATSVYRINQPGSYYLTGNVTGEGGKSGILIGTSHVTVDLMGFSVRGAPVHSSTNGILGPPTGGANIVIRNGALDGWGEQAVDLSLNTANVRLEGLSAFNCNGTGFKVNVNALVTDCAAYNCDLGGFVGMEDCVFRNCTARNCLFGSGIVTSGGCVENANTSFNNFFGIKVEDGNVTDCVASNNSSVGIICLRGVVEGCTSFSNGGEGISAGAAVVSRCSVYSNSEDGIRLDYSAIAIDNMCVSNGILDGDGAGIRVAGSDNRIEGNNCTGGDWGIRVEMHGNVILRNICSGNATQYDFVASNRYGPIINLIGVSSPAVSGSSAADASGTAHPWANFSY
jgi:parallel beta-helix repeat protein